MELLKFRNHPKLLSRVVREFNLPDSFSSVLQRAMEGGAGNAGNGRLLMQKK